MNWQTIITAIGVSSATVIAIVAFFGKALFESVFSRWSYEHQIRFSKLHERRADVLTTLYQKIARADRTLFTVDLAVTAFSDGEGKDAEGFASTFLEKCRTKCIEELSDAFDYFRMNRLFLDEKLCGDLLELEHAFDSALKSASATYQWDSQSDKIVAIIGKDQVEQLWEIREDLRAILEEIEAKFRRLLGVTV